VRLTRLCEAVATLTPETLTVASQFSGKQSIIDNLTDHVSSSVKDQTSGSVPLSVLHGFPSKDMVSLAIGASTPGKIVDIAG